MEHIGVVLRLTTDTPCLSQSRRPCVAHVIIPLLYLKQAISSSSSSPRIQEELGIGTRDIAGQGGGGSSILTTTGRDGHGFLQLIQPPGVVALHMVQVPMHGVEISSRVVEDPLLNHPLTTLDGLAFSKHAVGLVHRVQAVGRDTPWEHSRTNRGSPALADCKLQGASWFL